jgi:hypothetical protein
MSVSRFPMLLAVVAAMLLASPAHALLSPQELKCASTTAKAYAKLQATILKETSKCRNGDISGKVPDPGACDPLPEKAAAKVDKARSKFVSVVGKSCSSLCSITNEKVCVVDVQCPPVGNAAERCTGKGGKKPFRVTNLGFPGPYCPALLGREMRDPSDLGECLVALVDRTASPLVEGLYAELDGDSALSPEAQKCLASVSKAVTKSVGRAYLAVASCRNDHAANKVPNDQAVDPNQCATAFPKTVAAIDKSLDGIASAVTKACDDAAIAQLEGLCASGGAAPATVAEATACLTDMVREIATEARASHRHVYSRVGMLNVTDPETAYSYCGDGLIDSTRRERTGVGEECDGDDAPCSGGSCLPPGDLFGCTCDNVPRERLVIDGAAVDSDAGWTGDSHDATHNDNFGYVSELSNCDCTEFSQADCVGSSTDPVCDVFARMAPRCSDDIHGTQTCDARGDNDDLHEHADCFICDADSLNPGAHCAVSNNASESACDSQCFDNASGEAFDPAKPCTRQSDCGAGETCRGRCDNTVTCNIMTEGSPLPLVSAAIPVCISLEYLTDVTGTKDMVTGESTIHYTTRSVIQLGEFATQPCPSCAGMCFGGSRDGSTCSGRCNVSGAACLFDSDCTEPGDTNCLESDADCPDGSCSLDLRCSGGLSVGKLCQPDAYTPIGVVSGDCRVSPANNLSGRGVLQPFGTVTTGEVEHPVGGPCSDPSWTNYDCPCPDGGSSIKTRPNRCASACNAGPNVGKGCATGNGGSGTLTTCVSGSEAGSVCDEDADCDGGACTGNPKQCTAGAPSRIGQGCATNAFCDTAPMSGDGVCEDACPGGHCVPLCVEEGACDGGARDGLPCARDIHCTGGGTCVLADSEDGLCAAGPLKYRCTGDGYTTLPCAQANAGTQKGCEAGNDGVLGNEDDIPGAGTCDGRPLDCYVNNGYAEGGDTTNGKGSASDVKLVAAFCTPPNSNPSIDSVSGFGGPSRIRRGGSAFVNVPSIPAIP